MGSPIIVPRFYLTVHVDLGVVRKNLQHLASRLQTILGDSQSQNSRLSPATPAVSLNPFGSIRSESEGNLAQLICGRLLTNNIIDSTVLVEYIKQSINEHLSFYPTSLTSRFGGRRKIHRFIDLLGLISSHKLRLLFRPYNMEDT